MATQSGKTVLDQVREVIIGSQPGAAIPTVQITGSVQTGASSTLTAGVQTGTTAATALNNGSSLACTEVIVQNLPINTLNILIGSQALQSLHITPDKALTIPIDNVNKVYIRTTGSTSVVGWLARS